MFNSQLQLVSSIIAQINFMSDYIFIVNDQIVRLK